MPHFWQTFPLCQTAGMNCPENFSIPLYSLLPLYIVFFLPITRLRAALKFPRIPTRTKKVSVLSFVCHSPLSDLTISSPNHYDCILLMFVLYYRFYSFIIVFCFRLSLASWLLFSNKSLIQYTNIGTWQV